MLLLLLLCALTGCAVRMPKEKDIPKKRTALPVPDTKHRCVTFDVPSGWKVVCVGYHPFCTTDYALNPVDDDGTEMTISAGFDPNLSGRMSIRDSHLKAVEAIQAVHDTSVQLKSVGTIQSSVGPVEVFHYDSLSGEDRLAAEVRSERATCWIVIQQDDTEGILRFMPVLEEVAKSLKFKSR